MYLKTLPWKLFTKPLKILRKNTISAFLMVRFSQVFLNTLTIVGKMSFPSTLPWNMMMMSLCGARRYGRAHLENPWEDHTFPHTTRWSQIKASWNRLNLHDFPDFLRKPIKTNDSGALIPLRYRKTMDEITCASVGELVRRRVSPENYHGNLWKSLGK